MKIDIRTLEGKIISLSKREIDNGTQKVVRFMITPNTDGSFFISIQDAKDLASALITVLNGGLE